VHCASTSCTALYITNQSPKANSAFHPCGVGKWVPASAGKAKAGRPMVHSVSGCTWGVQVKLWDPLRTSALPERLRGVFTTRRYTSQRLPYLTLPLVLLFYIHCFVACIRLLSLWVVCITCCSRNCQTTPSENWSGTHLPRLWTCDLSRMISVFLCVFLNFCVAVYITVYIGLTVCLAVISRNNKLVN